MYVVVIIFMFTYIQSKLLSFIYFKLLVINLIIQLIICITFAVLKLLNFDTQIPIESKYFVNVIHCVKQMEKIQSFPYFACKTIQKLAVIISNQITLLIICITGTVLTVDVKLKINGDNIIHLSLQILFTFENIWFTYLLLLLAKRVTKVEFICVVLTFSTEPEFVKVKFNIVFFLFTL